MPHLRKETLWRVLGMMGRKKEFEYQEETELKRILNVLDLTFLGISSMVGMGVYIMVGDLATKVGPACVISFLIAGFACALSGVCYAEFAARIPCTGSAYAYSYITIGEFVAFVLGWNLALEMTIGTACLARAMSGYVDTTFFNGSIESFLETNVPMDVPSMASYADFFSFFLMMVFAALVCAGAKESTMLNNLFVGVNMTTIAVIIVLGVIHADFGNWSLPPSPAGGDGGFVPFGVSKVMEGAATCFYAYTGFDTVATTGNEAKNPKRSIPIALVSSILCAATVYGTLSLTFTLMWPYYDPELATGHPYPYVFAQLGLGWAKYLVGIGATCAVFGCMLSSTFGMSRIVYAIADDGLIFQSLSKINSRTRTPIRATVVSGIFTGIVAVVFNTDQLVDMTSLGTLMAYTMVAICVLILRYEDPEMESIEEYSTRNFGSGTLNKVLNTPVTSPVPNEMTSTIVKASALLAVILALGIGSMIAFFSDLLTTEPAVMIVATLLAILFVAVVVVIGRQPQSKATLSFKVHPVPFLPIICIFFNVYLMLKLNHKTWMRFSVWLVIGLVIYFTYGIWHSKQKLAPCEKKAGEKKKEEV
uniref:High affinity cationic amino acid transporter 1 n=1 Tax=Lygus hesperus TaxID=30085 RepID=A0A146LBN1_LYGHE